MKNFSKIASYSAAAFGLVMLAACGTENTTEVTGMDVLAKGEKLPDCTKDNAGDMLYIADSAAVYYCVDGEWASLNGKDGEPGTSTEGAPGTSCTAKAVEDGIEVICGDKVVGTLKNVSGTNGKSCSAVQDEKTKDVTITCETDDGKGKSYTIKNGEPGKNCSVAPNADGKSYTISCEGSADVTITNGTDGKSACAIAKNQETCTDDEAAAWLETLKGKQGNSCSVAPSEEGNSYTLSCEGSADVTITNGTDGKSACALAKGQASCTDEEVKAWLETLKGDKSKLCSFEEKADGVVEVTCGEGESEKKVTLYKAICGAHSYDPAVSYCTALDKIAAKKECGENKELYDAENQFCYDGKIYETCDKRPYDLANEFCDTGIDHVYKYVTIAPTGTNYSKVWMAENAVKKIEGTHCAYTGYDGMGDCGVYGNLYKWNEAQTACPAGWHLPSAIEWQDLFDAVTANGGYAADKLMSKTDDWRDGGNAQNTDEYSFSVRPTGYYKFDVSIVGEPIGLNGAYDFAVFWTRSYISETHAPYVVFENAGPYDRVEVLQATEADKFLKNRRAMAVRCVKDDESSASK